MTFAVAVFAMKQGWVSDSGKLDVVMVDARSELEAEAIGMRLARFTWPTSEGWTHHFVVVRDAAGRLKPESEWKR